MWKITILRFWLIELRQRFWETVLQSLLRITGYSGHLIIHYVTRAKVIFKSPKTPHREVKWSKIRIEEVRFNKTQTLLKKATSLKVSNPISK
jgi:hypothetical protein